MLGPKSLRKSGSGKYSWTTHKTCQVGKLTFKLQEVKSWAIFSAALYKHFRVIYLFEGDKRVAFESDDKEYQGAGGTSKKTEKARVVATPEADFYQRVKGNQLRIETLENALPPELAVERARGLVNMGGYNAIYNNCECFVRWCLTGVAHSLQAKWVQMAIMFCTGAYLVPFIAPFLSPFLTPLVVVALLALAVIYGKKTRSARRAAYLLCLNMKNGLRQAIALVVSQMYEEAFRSRPH